MTLAADIAALRDRTVAELVEVYDYFSDTESAWNLARRAIRLGQAVAQLRTQPPASPSGKPARQARNPVTGTPTTHQDLLVRAPGYVSGYLAEATFQQFLAVFESFVGDLIRLWLTAFPKSLGEKELRLKDVLEADDLAAVVRRVVDAEVFEITYKSPRKLFEYIKHRLGLPQPPAPEMDRLAEAKATRDVLIHARGVVDDEYLKKAGAAARFTTGNRADVPKPYHREVWKLLRKFVADLADGAIAKAPA